MDRPLLSMSMIGPPFLVIEFSVNNTKLAMLVMKASPGKSKIYSAKKLPPVGIVPGTSCGQPD